MPENLKGKVITREAQKKLFESLIETYVDRAKEYFDGELDSNNNIVEWDSVDGDIKQVLIDMAYRGDLKSVIVDNVMDMVSETDKNGLASFVGNPASFRGIVSTLPDSNRCQQRKDKLT